MVTNARTYFLCFLVALSFLAGTQAGAAERIINFSSRIVINQDSTVRITETIKVESTGNRIKRGIYRDFPTAYTDRAGNRVEVSFRVTSVLRDGRNEPYFVRVLSNGQRIFIGDRDIQLKPGIHTYILTYVTDSQIGYFDDYDELYWNVTGNGWAFPIERASAVIVLPPGATVVQKTAYTGRKGEKGTDYIAGADGRGNPSFSTSRALGPGEGLTIAVAWPKGLVKEPTAVEKTARFLSANLATGVALVGLILVLGYYLIVWFRVGRDLPAGPVVPLFEPPEGFSPAATRFVWRMDFDDKAFASAIINMAVKGHLAIEETDGEFNLRKTGETASPALSPGEWKIDSKLFQFNDAITLKQKNHAEIKAAVKALEESLVGEFKRVHFVTNRFYLIPGTVLTALAAMVVALASPGDIFTTGFLMVWLGVWTIVCSALAVNVFQSWRSLFAGAPKITPISWSGPSGGGVYKAKAPVITLFSLPFFAGEIFGFVMLSQQLTVAATLILLAMVLTTAIFLHLLKAPTLTGRKAMDKMDGFRMFLSVAEKDRLDMLHPPEVTPELFERFLPYAMALEVEHQWSENFAGVLAAAGTETAPYRPRWYHGHAFSHHDLSAFASNMGGALSTAISSSSTAPGSSSGSGGGGFSGGGGGGGGGGGW